MNLARRLSALSVAVFGLTFGDAASATVVNFALAPTLGSVGVAAGTLTAADPISNSGLVTIFNVNLSFMVGGNTFAKTTGSASFPNGSLSTSPSRR